jgi:DNA-binding sugar fermentation-stimulating protein
VKTESPDIPFFAIPEVLSCREMRGCAAFLLFVAALPYVVGFKPYRLADPKLFDLLEIAKNLGVQVKALGLYFRPTDCFLYLYDPDLDVVIRCR